MSVATPVRRRQPVVVAATLICAASMLGLGSGRSSMRVANAKAKAELGWRPAYPTYHDGIRAMAAAAAARKEEPWPSPGRSGAGTRSA